MAGQRTSVTDSPNETNETKDQNKSNSVSLSVNLTKNMHITFHIKTNTFFCIVTLFLFQFPNNNN